MPLPAKKIGILLFVCVLFSQVFCFAQSQADLTTNACDSLKKEEEEMMITYKKIISLHSKDKQFLSTFEKAQNLWKSFAQAHVDSIYYPGQHWGTVEPMCRCTEEHILTSERHEQLKQWLKKTEEGFVCNGSRSN